MLAFLVARNASAIADGADLDGGVESEPNQGGGAGNGTCGHGDDSFDRVPTDRREGQPAGAPLQDRLRVVDSGHVGPRAAQTSGGDVVRRNVAEKADLGVGEGANDHPAAASSPNDAGGAEEPE